MFYKLYKKNRIKKLNLYINIDSFGSKVIEKIKKGKRYIHFTSTNQQESLQKKNITNKEIFNLLVNLCMRKGYKNFALNTVKSTFSLLRTFFWTESFFFIRLILTRSEAVFKLQRYFLGKREKIIPRFINEKKKFRYVLRMVVNYARILQKEYKYFNISFAHAILEYSKSNNVLTIINKQENELAESNKYFLFKKNKKRRRKIRLFRKINNWKHFIK